MATARLRRREENARSRPVRRRTAPASIRAPCERFPQPVRPSTARPPAVPPTARAGSAGSRTCSRRPRRPARCALALLAPAGARGARRPARPPAAAPPPLGRAVAAPVGDAAAGDPGVRPAGLAVRPRAPRGRPGRRTRRRCGAAGAGVVVFAGMVAGRPVVSIDHAGGLRTTYEPVDPSVAAGQAVARGSPIGTLAGRASGLPGRRLPALGPAPRRGLPRSAGLLRPPRVRLLPLGDL